jgi:hypothetical protein
VVLGGIAAGVLGLWRLRKKPKAEEPPTTDADEQ